MDWKAFWMPTQPKVLSTLLLASVVLVSEYLASRIANLLIPPWLLETLKAGGLEGSFEQLFAEHSSELLLFTLQALLVKVLLLLVLVYAAVCFVFHLYVPSSPERKSPPLPIRRK